MEAALCMALCLSLLLCGTAVSGQSGPPRQTATVRGLVTLQCGDAALSSGKGSVKWSRERRGAAMEDILTSVKGGNTKHIEDRQRRFGSQADGALSILQVRSSDSGRYLCNGIPAVDLVVTPEGTRGEDQERGSSDGERGGGEERTTALITAQPATTGAKQRKGKKEGKKRGHNKSKQTTNSTRGGGQKKGDNPKPQATGSVKYTAAVGGQAYLHCGTSRTPSHNERVQWKVTKDGVDYIVVTRQENGAAVKGVNDPQNRLSLLTEDASLLITAVHPEDAGQYSCNQKHLADLEVVRVPATTTGSTTAGEERRETTQIRDLVRNICIGAAVVVLAGILLFVWIRLSTKGREAQHSTEHVYAVIEELDADKPKKQDSEYAEIQETKELVRDPEPPKEPVYYTIQQETL
ncbi:uncharacterized protein LOC136711077 isoform X2 [Amia ocellicauda]|uniref:uncharacterized protein LOC136711077 isoform X2 n=1 Tax=Amia ocellicauda TaxID=2972642 RepID=UPI0034644011